MHNWLSVGFATTSQLVIRVPVARHFSSDFSVSCFDVLISIISSVRVFLESYTNRIYLLLSVSTQVKYLLLSFQRQTYLATHLSKQFTCALNQLNLQSHFVDSLCISVHCIPFAHWFKLSLLYVKHLQPAQLRVRNIPSNSHCFSTLLKVSNITLHKAKRISCIW